MLNSLEKEYKKLVFDLIENDLVKNGNVYSIIFRLFNRYECERLLGIDNGLVDYIVNDELFEDIKNQIDTINRIDDTLKYNKKHLPQIDSKYNVYELVKMSIRKDINGFLYINGEGEFKSFTIRKMNSKNYSDFIKIRDNNYRGKHLYELKMGGICWKGIMKYSKMEFPNKDMINKFFKYQKFVLDGLGIWYRMGCKWYIKFKKLNESKIKNYDGFLFDMEVSLFWSKQKEIKHITKGIYGKYWNWNDYNNLKIKRKDKQFIKDIEYYKELMDMRM
tara:strand:+ start:1465 stop:2292 length:828 start_codon:yes stop_codon:yes gene_type:complete